MLTILVMEEQANCRRMSVTSMFSMDLGYYYISWPKSTDLGINEGSPTEESPSHGSQTRMCGVTGTHRSLALLQTMSESLHQADVLALYWAWIQQHKQRLATVSGIALPTCLHCIQSPGDTTALYTPGAWLMAKEEWNLWSSTLFGF